MIMYHEQHGVDMMASHATGHYNDSFHVPQGAVIVLP